MDQMIENMLNQAKQVAKNAYSPYSKFSVGTCIRATDGKFYCGCNIENISYSLTLCAETSAIAAMLSAGSTEIAEVVIFADGSELSTSCGACRQRMQEFSKPDVLVHAFNNKDDRKTLRMDELLPQPFSFDKI
ncbi:MAG: cytidine deaminase [Gammaproteobacteria bacterium]|jgi:cytidine deaminase